MKYTIAIETNGQPVYKQDFSNDIPLINRRKAVKAMKELIEAYKNGQAFELLKALLPGNENLLELTKDTMLKNTVYTVALDYSESQQPIRIESNAISEESLDEWRVIEYMVYLEKGWNTGGEPIETFIPRMNRHVPILRDCFKNEIGLSELLKTE